MAMMPEPSINKGNQNQPSFKMQCGQEICSQKNSEQKRFLAFSGGDLVKFFLKKFDAKKFTSPNSMGSLWQLPLRIDVEGSYFAQRVCITIN